MNNIIKRKWNQNSMVIIEDLQGMAFQAESGGHTFQISGIDGEGNAVALSGTPAGVMLRSDGQDVTLTCSVSEGVVSATLPANAYSVPGRFGLTIFLTSDGQKTAIYAAVGTVGKTSSGTVAPPAGSDVVTLVNAIATAVATIPASYTDLMASVAPTYSSSGLYAVGSYAWYNGKLYRCTTAITSGETWNSGHWTLANLGSDLVDLKSELRQNYANVVNIEKGGWSSTNGTPIDSNYWCRTNKYINKNLIVKTSSVNMWLQAYDNRTGAFVGAWNGTEFSPTYDDSLAIKFYNIAEFTENYPNYMFAISFKTINLTPSDLYSELVVENAEDNKISLLNSELQQNFADVIIIEQGYWAGADGKPGSSETWCRTKKFINKESFIRTAASNMWLAAYNKTTLQYVGTWNGSSFAPSFYASLEIKELDIAKFVKEYPNLVFAISFKRPTGNITPSDIYSEIKIENQVENNISWVREELGLYGKCSSGSKHLVINPSGETIIGGLNIISGHTYRIVAKSSLPVGASVYLGLGYNGNIEITSDQFYAGYEWIKKATTSNSNSRVYIVQTNGIIDGTVSVVIEDLDVTNKVEDQVKEITTLKLSELSINPSLIHWEDGMINYTTGEIESYGSYLHSELVFIDCDAESVFAYTGLRFYDANGTLIGSVIGANTKLVINTGTYKYMKFVISGQDATNFRVYSTDNKTIFDGIENVSALMRNAHPGNINAKNNMNQFFTIVHVTDVHGDRVRFGRAVDFAELIGADAIINTGDSVRYDGTDDFSFVTRKIQNTKTLYLQTIGNHDVRSNTTEEGVYSKFIDPFVEKYSYNVGGTNKSYYYIDNTAKKIRAIVVNQYEKYDGSMDAKLTKTQIDWFCNVLVNTPENYGVVVCFHIPESTITKDNNHDVFYQYPNAQEHTSLCFTKIVDAFISGTTFSEQLWGETITADFTQKNENVEFIAYLNGHQHQDLIGYADSTNMQLVLNSICTNAWFNINTDGTIGTSYPYYNELNDLGRFNATPTQDAFNVYCIDRTTGDVKVVRIGSHTTFDLHDRSRMIIPYKNS